MSVTQDDLYFIASTYNRRPNGSSVSIPCPAPGHPGNRDDDNCSVTITKEGKLLAKCHSHECDFRDIVAGLERDGAVFKQGSNPPGGNPELQGRHTTTEYHHADGRVVTSVRDDHDGPCWRNTCKAETAHKHVWQEPKGMLRKGFLAKIWNDGASNPVVAEGEKAALAIAEAGYTAVSYVGGSKAAAHADYSPLAGRDVIIWPDNDAPGQDAATKALAALRDAGVRSVSIVVQPEGAKDGADAADCDADTIRELIENAVPAAPTAAPAREPQAIRQRAEALKGAGIVVPDDCPHERKLADALRELQQRCDALPETLRFPIEVTIDQDLYATTERMWAAVVSKLGTGTDAKLFTRNSSPVTATRWADKRRGSVHEIQDADADRLQGLSAQAIWWHSERKHKALARGDMTPRAGDALATETEDGGPSIIDRIAAAEALPHANVVYRDAYTFVKNSKTIEVPESWGMDHLSPRRPHKQLTHKLLSMADGRGLQPLERVVDHPLLVRRDGKLTLVDTPGYCPEAAALLTDGAAVGRDLPSIEQAIKDLDHLYGGFPFDSNASRANCYAMHLSFVCGPLCGAKPAFLGDKTLPRTGATLLMRTASQVMAGRPPVLAEAPSKSFESETEMKKTLLSAGLTGAPAVLMDNVVGTLDGSTWSTYTTSEVWNSRLLGGNREGYVDRTTIVDMLTSNGLQFSRDTAARVRAIRLDAKRPDPENRTFGFHPETEARENRAKYLRAVVALVHHWLKAGAPMQSDASDFGQWKNVVRGILEVAGVPGFDDETLMPVADRVADGGEAEFVSAWWHAAEGKLLEAAALVGLAYGDDAGQGGTMDPPSGDRKTWARSLSKRLGSMDGRYYMAGGTAVRLDTIRPDRQAGKPARFRLSASGTPPGDSQNSQNSQKHVSRSRESNPPWSDKSHVGTGHVSASSASSASGPASAEVDSLAGDASATSTAAGMVDCPVHGLSLPGPGGDCGKWHGVAET